MTQASVESTPPAAEPGERTTTSTSSAAVSAKNHCGDSGKTAEPNSHTTIKM